MIGLSHAAARDESAAGALQKALDDPSVEVRLIAAEALCLMDRPQAGLPVLSAGLTHPSEWVRLQAANSLDRIGEKARPALDAVRKVAADPSDENLFVRWVLAHTLRQLTRATKDRQAPFEKLLNPSLLSGAAYRSPPPISEAEDRCRH